MVEASGNWASFEYNADGLRIRKNLGSIPIDYTLHGKRIVHLTQLTDTLHFFYDAQGRPSIVDFNGTKYGYIHNLQGDIVAIIDGSGTPVVEYTYDAWGKPLSKTGSMANTLGALNPFRYRGYVYDEETGLYYLRSRYYNPEWGRFLNADSVLGKPGQLLRHNVFAYCLNNPVIIYDSSGNIPQIIVGNYDSGSIAGGASGAGVLAIIGYAIYKGVEELVNGIIGILNLNESTRRASAAVSTINGSIVARPAVVARTKTRELEDITASDQMTGALYYMAWVNKNDGYLRRSSYGMHYTETVLFLGYSETIARYDSYFKDSIAWGVYTLYQPDAKLLAVSLGNNDAPETHGIGFYGHYHDEDHGFHIWFGMPLE